MTIVWTDELLTGDCRIDEQHRRLFQLFNDLHAAIGRREGGAEIGRTLTALSVYVVAHFRMEEELMLQTGYAGLETHREAHQLMRGQVEGMVDRYHSFGLDSTEVMRVLKHWLIVHVQNIDMAMAQFLLSCPGSPRSRADGP